MAKEIVEPIAISVAIIALIVLAPLLFEPQVLIKVLIGLAVPWKMAGEALP